MRRLAVLALAGALSVTLGVAACGDDGPSGPGDWEGLVRSSAVSAGAVIMEVSGTGIEDVVGSGSVQAFGERTSGPGAETEVWRVVLVAEEAGPMAFRIQVEDLADGAPRAVVLAAVDGENVPLSAIASFSVDLNGR